MRRLPVLPMLLLALAAGCGDGGDNDAEEADSSESPTTITETTQTPEGESEDCRLAVSKWADRADDHILDSKISSVFGESLKLENLDDPASEIKVLCSDDLNEAVENALRPLLRANYELALCAAEIAISDTFSCKPEQTRRVERFANRADSLIDLVRIQADL